MRTRLEGLIDMDSESFKGCVNSCAVSHTNELVPGESLCAALAEGMLTGTSGVSSEKKSGDRARRGEVTGMRAMGRWPCLWEEPDATRGPPIQRPAP